jgi:hypothetical protein
VKKAVVVYGREDQQGRALFVTSALYHCADCFQQRTIRFVGVRSLNVEVAAQVLAADKGLDVEISSVNPAENPTEAFRDAILYLAVVFRDATDVAGLKAGDLGVPVYVAVQFPCIESLSAELAGELAAAHDTVILGNRIRKLLSC